MTLIETAGKLLPPHFVARLTPVFDRLETLASATDETSAAQRMAMIAFAIRICSAAIAFVSQIILARLMGDFEYGIFVFVWVIAIILGNLSCLGFHTAVIRFLPQYRTAGADEAVRGLAITARIFAMLSATLIAGTGIAALHFLGDRIESHYVQPLFVGAFVLPMIALGDVLDGTARANGWPVHALSPTYIVRPLLILAFVAGAIWLGRMADANTAIIAALAATYVTTLTQFTVVTTRLRRRYPAKRIEIHFRTWLMVAFPIFLIEGFYFMLTNADVIIVGIYLPPEKVAVYFAAAKTMALVHFVYFAVKAAAAQRFSGLVSDPDRSALASFAQQTVQWTFWPSLICRRAGDRRRAVPAFAVRSRLPAGPHDHGHSLRRHHRQGHDRPRRGASDHGRGTQDLRNGLCRRPRCQSGSQCHADSGLGPAWRRDRNCRRNGDRGRPAAHDHPPSSRHRHVHRLINPAAAHRTICGGRIIMASSPIIQEEVASQANSLIGEFADVETGRPLPEREVAIGRPGRHLAIYPARAGYDLQEELDFLTNRALEPNIFFAARFLAPAMPGLKTGSSG
jgi:hypothetical protein